MKTVKELEAELAKEKLKVELLKEMLAQAEKRLEAPPSYLFRMMTMKQHATLQMLMRGAANDDIAHRLAVALPTAKGYVRTMCLNAGLRNRAALVARYKPIFDSMGDREYELMTGGLRKDWDRKFTEDDPINEVVRRKKHESDDS